MDKFTPADLRWEDRGGIHYLVDPKGKVVGTVRKTADGIFESAYGLQANEKYIDLASAREAVVEAFRIGLETPPKKEEKAPKKEKKDG